MGKALPAGLAGHPALWRGKQRRHDSTTLATGHPRLDRILPGGGWPLGATVEVLTARPGMGEFSLLLPALARVTTDGRWAMLVNPPWTPYPPALCGHGVNLAHLLLVHAPQAADALWACEQALRGMQGGMVLAWPPPTVQFAQLRRLQLAAHGGGKVAVLFRAAEAAGSAAPAPLRLHLHADDQALQVRVLKCRGARPGVVVRLHCPHRTPRPAETGSASPALAPDEGWLSHAPSPGLPARAPP